MKKSTFSKIVKKYLNLIYYKELKKKEINLFFNKIILLFESNKRFKSDKKLWDENDFFLITYADSIKKKKN